MTKAIDCAYSVEGEGPPLFLIHGIGAARNTWRKALPILTPHFTVVTYDLRGHGESPMPQQPFGLDELVADLEAVRERTGFEQAHFAGHSLGGMISPASRLRSAASADSSSTLPPPPCRSPPPPWPPDRAVCRRRALRTAGS